MRAAVIARDYVKRLRLPARLDGTMVLLADYETQGDKDFLKPGEDWTLGFHREVNVEFGRLLESRGAVVKRVLLRMGEYFDWLVRYDLPNTTANRAQFVAWSTAPEPKPTPIS